MGAKHGVPLTPQQGQSQTLCERFVEGQVVTFIRAYFPMVDSDLFFIIVLLIRHFKYYGGLVLPPMQAARVKQAVHEALVESEKALNRSTELLFIHYPNW